jgi:RHS repeat-associated protein
VERTVFTGYLWDKETNLFFAKARFYDPEVWPFISQDSIPSPPHALSALNLG